MRTVLLFGTICVALHAQQPTLAVVEKIAGAVGFYSATGQRIAGVKVGTHPHEIIYSPDKRYLYVTNNGILWMEYAGEGGNTISVIDAKTRQSAGVIDLGNHRRPHGMDIDPKTGRLVVTTENPDGLLLVDTKTRKVLRKYDVKGEDPHMVTLDANAEWAYVSNSTTNTIAAIHLESGNVKLIPSDKRPQGGVLSRDGKLIFITNADGNSISIIDPAKQTRIGAIPTGRSPGRVAQTPDRKTLVYCLGQGEAVGFADIATRQQTGIIPLGGRPLSLTMSADGKLAYAGVQDQDKVYVISVAERKILRVIQTPKGSGPDPALPL